MSRDLDKAVARIPLEKVRSDSPPSRMSAAEQDRNDLARMGKKQVLKRQFGFVSMMGFGCIVLSTWEGALVLFASAFQNGGPSGLIYGFIIVWVGTLSVFTTLSELASMAPVSSGQYHWCAMLAPSGWARVASYTTGWLTVVAWQAAVISASFLTGTMIQGLVMLNYPEYIPTTWQAMLIMWASLLFAVFLNTLVSNVLPTIEGAILITHVLGFFGILIPLVYLSPTTSDPSDVFNSFINNGNWPTMGLSFWVGISATVFMFLGADSIIHMSEEVQRASVVVPRAVLGSIIVNGLLGFGMVIAVLFTLGDPEVILEGAFIYPFIQIFYDAVQSKGGATAMVVLIIALTSCSTVGLLASSSRMTWSFARDRGLPGWRYLSKVESRTSIPIVAIAVTTVIAVLFDLIDLGSSTALNDVISLTVNSFYASYLISAALLLWRRCTGAIKDSNENSTIHNVASGEEISTPKLTWGPFRIPGKLGIINNIYACAWMIVVFFFTAWPTATPVTAATMNYSIFITIFVAIVSAVYYMVWGKHTYQGPIAEVVLPS